MPYQQERADQDVATAAESSTGRASMRAWTEAIAYQPAAMLHKLFHDDILLLLSMDKLWQERAKPVVWSERTAFAWESVPPTTTDSALLPEQRLWSAAECQSKFMSR